MRKRKILSLISIVCIAAAAAVLFSGCSLVKKEDAETSPIKGWKPESHMKLEYADQFAIDYYKGGYKLIKLHDGSQFLVVPEGKKAPKGLDKDVVVLQQPLDHIYLAATASMCLFDKLDGLDNIKYSGAQAEDWYIQNARTAMEQGKITYAGKYDQPDYEMLASGQCDLAIENTMINHSPDVKKKLEEFDIPVFMDQASLEKEPLGRTEWIKVYGAMLNKEDQANEIFNEQVKKVKSIKKTDTGKTVAFFTILPSGQVVVRKSGDYVSKMIEMAGGEYVFKNIGDKDDARATVTIDMEEFYKKAKDADVLIYNSTIEGPTGSLDQLEAMSPLLRNFKAVKKGNVWCTGQNMYQDTTSVGQIILDINTILTSDDPPEQLTYMTKLS
ncbi:ABC transporter substrate-binding protein [Mobilibacterium timonense]|uniref:ABC transporter substrate-binding protein n=1 Tax=Mobilibacterium timonense TaxID=1871012 RepID=UPI0009876EAC|nr:ABC transporter substrate-binding protein [Mobilibacterium timonense]